MPTEPVPTMRAGSSGLALGGGCCAKLAVGLVHREPLDGITPLQRLQLVDAAVAHVEQIRGAARGEPRRGQRRGAGLIGAAGDGFAHLRIRAGQPVDEPGRIAVGFLRRRAQCVSRTLLAISPWARAADPSATPQKPGRSADGTWLQQSSLRACPLPASDA